MIGVDAGINVSAASISAGGALFANIFNLAGGTIVGNANINFNLTGDLQTVGDASFSILNGGGTIGGDSSIGSAANHFTLTGDLTLRATRTF